MDKLPPHIAALVDAARTAHDPAPEDREKVAAALAAAIPGSSLGSAGTQSAATSGAGGSAVTEAAAAGASESLFPPAAVGLGLGSKLLIAAAVVGVVGGLAALKPWERPDEDPRETLDREPVAETVRPAEPALAARAGRATATTSAHAVDRLPDTEPVPPVVDGVLSSKTVRPVPGVSSKPPRSRKAAREARKAPISTTDRAVATTTAQADRYRASNTNVAAGEIQKHAVETREEELAAPAPVPEPEMALAERVPARSRGDEELTLIRTATEALRDGHPEYALIALQEHASRFPRGVLQQERRALRVLALCELGRLERGRRERERFLRENPDSPFAGRVRRACPGAAGR